jgi:hypothetical protein
VLAAGPIRDNRQAHLAPARVGEQPPSSTPTPLPVRTIRGSAGPDYRILGMRKLANSVQPIRPWAAPRYPSRTKAAKAQP